MGLYAVRIEDLHDPAEINALHEVIDIRMPDVMTEHEKRLLDVLRLRQRHDEVSQISESRVHLDDYDRSIAGQWSERLLIVHSLLRVRSLDLTPDLRDLELRERSRTGVRQARGRIATLL